MSLDKVLVVALVFLGAFKALRWLEWSGAWRVGGAAAVALLAYPAATYLVSSAMIHIATTPICFPLLIPLLIILAALGGYLAGYMRWFSIGRSSRW